MTLRASVLKAGVSAVAVAACAATGSSAALAKGGTQKPPTVSAVPLVNILPPAGPTLLTPASTATGFSVTGFIQSATVTGTCTNLDPTAGGTALVNGLLITIPSNVIVQFPAFTASWRDAVCPSQPNMSPLGLDGSGGSGGAQTQYPSNEITFEGNVVNGVYMAALVHISQQSLHAGAGVISSIDYTDGSLYVTSGGVGGGQVRLLINDPFGRFGRVQSNPDVRFSVDDANPTIKTAATGYPMCVPRSVDPATGLNNPVVGGVPQDPLCPQKNRPTAPTCRTFLQTGIAIPAGGDITTTPAGFCRAFVMKAIAGMPGTAALGATQIAGATDPDPRQQAPFEVGDYISWGGTLVRGVTGAQPTTTPDTIWVHTIDANVGIYTQPRTLPAYVAVGEFGIGVDPNPTGAAVTPGVEATARIFLEAGVSDVASIVDIYLDDKGYTLPVATPNGPIVPTAGREYFRWVTLETMTGALTDQAGGKIPFVTSAQPFGGGIQTQFTGPQTGRARIRANKVPAINAALGACPTAGGSQACAVTQSPTRYLRVVVRSLCAPASGFPSGTPAGNPGNLDGGAFFSINGARAALPGSAAGGDGTCLQSAQYANGLFTGQYMAPVGEYIFPENTLAGAPILPNNLWQLDFLSRGEGSATGTDGISRAGVTPVPW